MAADWIKMRTDLYRDPKVCMIADSLMDNDSELARYVSNICRCNMAVTRNIMRNAIVGSLVTVWGVLRHRGARIDDDLVVNGATVAILDDIAEMPGVGEAMAAVGWVTQTEEGLLFRHFFEEYNVEPEKKTALSNAERQRLYRERKRDSETVTNVTLRNDREEKSRVEKSNNTTTQESAGADSGEAATTAGISTKPKSLIPGDDDDDDPPKTIKKAKPDSINPGDLVVAWNRCVGLAPITSMTAKRKTALRARSRDPIFRDNWQAAIQRVGTTVFCCGGGPRGWRADVDWFLRPDTIVQIMEGKYDDRDTNGNNGGGVSSHRGISSEEARLQRSLQACEDFARNG